MQLLRPRMGYGSDVGQRHTPWIVWGIVALAVGAIGAASSIAVMQSSMTFGLALAMLSYGLIGGGVSASGTSLLVLLAKRVDAPRRAAASTVVWMMMIAGFGHHGGSLRGASRPLLAPRGSLPVASGVGAVAVVVTLVAIRGVEGRRVRAASQRRRLRKSPPTTMRSAPPSARCGASEAPATSRSSCSSRCSPIARRT